MKTGYRRREFLELAGGASLALAAGGGCRRARRQPQRFLVLGIDGMDPTLLQRFLAEGRMPNCRRLIARGGFAPLRTSDPPQSPVAWSNFIAGTNPGGHGIFDFIARDPATLKPFLSTSRIEREPDALTIGNWQIPLRGGAMQNLRGGPTFWQALEQAGVPATVIRMPANFPPVPGRARTLSGLGTPDIHGSYGVFSFFTDDPREISRTVSGGEILKVFPVQGAYTCRLKGPNNSLRANGGALEQPFTVYADPMRQAARIAIGGDNLLLQAGTWSPWVRVRFTMIPGLAATRAICRFYLRSVHPHLALYVTPLNIDPEDPALPISTPDSYAGELSRRLGPFYTQGMAEDTAACSAGIFSDAEYREQATMILNDSLQMYQDELNRFRDGFLFYYFSSLDMNSHMFWRTLDRDHPLFSTKTAEQHGDFIPWLYGQMDEAIGYALARCDDRTSLLVVSDHGFSTFRRQFHLNTWLVENGWATMHETHPSGRNYFADTDWRRTQAYGLGINGLYLNVASREPEGIVSAASRLETARKLAAQLEQAVDPQTGERIVSRAHVREDVYHGPYVEQAPDLVVSYAPHYRASWDTILGAYSRHALSNNLDPWSGDHAIDSLYMSGVCLSSHPLTTPQPGLQDMAPSILAGFGLPPMAGMTGSNVLSM